METNIRWARDADSGPVGLCSYSWVCVRAVRDSWLIHLVLFPVLCCGVRGCVWLLLCQGGKKREGRWAWSVPLGGWCGARCQPCSLGLCVHGGFWLCTGAMLALSRNILYGTYTCYLILVLFCFGVFFELLLAKFSLSQGLLFAYVRLRHV